jgi:rare lipoprotein A
MSGISRRVTLLLLAGAVTVLLAACAGEAPRVEEPADGPSTTDLKPGDVADAVPRAEPLARYGNHSPYEVFGRKYHVLPSSKGYHERGTASWYGSKFHGRRTSSGEPYDMHLATAAHKSLPLPTYAEVTNLDNGRKVIVKINDRGPFVDDRIIDLSYAAAIELDMVGTGTAPVFVRALGAPAAPPVTVTQSPPPVAPPPAATRVARSIPPSESAATLAERVFAQIGAFGDYANAARMLGRLRAAGIVNASIVTAGAADGASVHRVRVGPLRDEAEFDAVNADLRRHGFEQSHMVVERIIE